MKLSIKQALAVMNDLGLDVRHGPQHYLGTLVLDGVAVLVVHCVRRDGDGALAGEIPERFRDNLMLTAPEFADLCDRKITRDAYFDLLRSRLREQSS